MKRYLDQVRAIQLENSWQGASDKKETAPAIRYLPIIVAGDIFHKWMCPPELINFAMENMPPNVWVIPGQHDIPNHNMEDIERSAYRTLVRAGVVKELQEPLTQFDTWNLAVYPFPWGSKITPAPVGKHDQWTRLCVAHSYVWKGKASYEGAPPKQEVRRYYLNLEGYDAAVFGDNHKRFYDEGGPCPIFNPGTFIRRKSDEIDHKPVVGLLYKDGRVEQRALDCSEDDVAAKVKDKDAKGLRAEGFMGALDALADQALNFEEEVVKQLDARRVDKAVRKIAQRCVTKQGD